MAIAVFGSKIFEITDSKNLTFSDFQYGSTLETEKQDATGAKPSTYNKGPGLDSLSIKIRLSVDLGVNPRIELGQWLDIKDAGIAYPFILGSGPFRRNKWLLVEVQASDEVIDNQGNVLALTLSLKFDEYVRLGSKTTKLKTKSSSKAASSAEAVVDYEDDLGDDVGNDGLTDDEKGQLK